MKSIEKSVHSLTLFIRIVCSIAVSCICALFMLGLSHLIGSEASCATSSYEKSITIIIPSYNNKDWYRRNLDSVLMQDYHHFRVIYIDDASTDGTGDLVKEYLQENDLEHRVTLVQNQQRVGALANTYRGAWMCASSDVIAIVDGDDWLYHERVLQSLNKAYSDPNVWMTYGQFIEYPTGNMGGAAKLPDEIILKNAFREYDWVTTHLRTFYAGLFQKIRKEDLLYNLDFFPVTADLAVMFPLLEMSGIHSRFIPDTLYVYNIATPLNDRKLHINLQIYLDSVIRNRNRYLPVDNPF